MLPNHGLATEEKGRIKTSVLRAERLVNVSKHDYALEPNVSFTPDMKWGVFRTNMFGPT
jgi:oligogalacturonide lyase